MAHNLSPAELTALFNPVFAKGASKTVSGAATSAGLINLTATAHGLVVPTAPALPLMVEVTAVTGTVEANGFWFATVPDANHITLAASVFTNAYVSGGVLKAVSFSAGLVAALTTVQLLNLASKLDHAPYSPNVAVAVTLTPAP